MTDEDGPLRFVADSYKVLTADNPSEPQLLRDLDPWHLLNLPIPVILSMGEELHLQYGITPEFLASALSPYLVQTAGIEELIRKYDISAPPQYLISNTKHYSWPKSAGESMRASTALYT